jgi:hypothetical protein
MLKPKISHYLKKDDRIPLLTRETLEHVDMSCLAPREKLENIMPRYMTHCLQKKKRYMTHLLSLALTFSQIMTMRLRFLG